MPRSLSELLAEYKASRPGALEQGGKRALARTGDIGGAVQRGGEGLGFGILADYITALGMGVPVEEVTTARKALREQQAQAQAGHLAVPPPVTTGEKASQYILGAAPDIALGVASAPLSTGVTALSRASGSRLLPALLKGEAAQSALLAPVEFATRPPGEAALVTAAAPILGTALSAGVRGISRALTRSAADEVVAPPPPTPPNPITRAVREAQARQDELATTITPRIRTAQEEFVPRPTPPPPPPPPQPGALARAVREARARQDELATTITSPVKQVGEFTPRPRIPRPPPIPPENLAPIAPLKTPTGEVAVGTPEAKALTEDLKAKVFKIRTTAATEQAAAQRQWPGWTPQKEQLFQNLTGKGVSEAQAKHLLSDTEMAGRYSTALRSQGMVDAADAFDRAMGRPVPRNAPLAEIESLAASRVGKAPAELVASIQKDGIKEPLQVGVTPDGTKILFEGKHRLAAARELGMTEVPFVEVPIGPGMEELLQKEGTVTTLSDALEALGPAATKTMSDVVDEMPPGLAKRFLDNSEAGFIQLGKPMTVGNLVDRILHWRLGGMLSGTATATGNVTGNTISAGGLIPQRALAAPISQVGRLVLGRGPTLSIKDAGYQTLGYMQGLANLIQGVRKRQAVGMVKGDVLRFAEASRTVRVMQEGADPFAEAGTIGTVVGAVPNATLKYGLEVPDKLMWDPIFTGNALVWAHRKALANGARGKVAVDREMRRLLNEANRQSITATTQAKSFVRSEAKTIAQKRAGEAGRKAIGAAEERLAQARKAKVGLPEAADALRIAREQADEAMRTAELTPAEIEQIERSIMRELEPDIIQADVGTLKSLMDEARFLTERAMFMAREGKKQDVLVDYVLHTPVLDRIRKIVLPVLRTPANGVREAIRTSPVGGPLAFVKLLQAGGYRQFRESGMDWAPAMAAAMKSVDDAGLVKLYDDLAQATYGTAIMYGTYAALDHGLIKVVPYTPGMRKEERLALEAQGIPTDSLVIGNWAIPLRRLEPIARGIRAADRLLRLNAEKPDDEIFNQAEALAKEYVVAAADDVWLSGVQELMSAATDDVSAAGYANKLGGSFVPRFAQQIGGLVRGERVSRKPTEGVLKELIKGPHQAVGIGKPDLGLFGRPRTTTALYGLTGFSMKADDPLLQELTAVDYFPSTRLPKIDLSEGESQDATQVKGFIQEQALKALIARPEYQALETPELKKKAMERTIDRVGSRVGKVIRARKQAGMSLSYADLLQVLAK